MDRGYVEYQKLQNFISLAPQDWHKGESTGACILVVHSCVVMCVCVRILAGYMKSEFASELFYGSNMQQYIECI